MDNYLDEILRKHFQKNITLYLDNNIYKEGKFILYKIMVYSNNFYIEFHIKTDKKIEMVKIPYPFKVEEYIDESLMYFDYRTSTLVKNDSRLNNLLTNYVRKNSSNAPNKFLNKILEIQFS